MDDCHLYYPKTRQIKVKFSEECNEKKPNCEDICKNKSMSENVMSQ